MTLQKWFLGVANICAQRSTCLRRQVGAVIAKDNLILSTGYNGAPAGCKHCSEVGCLRQQLKVPSGERHELCRGAHAEQNAINHAAKLGVQINGATLYCNTYPCSMCAKSIINSGIKTVIYVDGYPDPLTNEFFSQSNIKVIQATKED